MMASRSLSRFPSEVLVCIAEACDTFGQASLCRSSRRLNELVTPILYRQNVQEDFGSAMYWAAQHGRIDILERLRAWGAEVNDNSGSQLDNVYEPLCPYPFRRPHDAYFTPLHVAAKFGQDDAVRWLLQHGARIEASAHNLCACQHGATDAVNDDEFEPCHSPLCTPLHIAICSGQSSTAMLLLQRGANAGPMWSWNSEGTTTALHTAARCGDAAMVRHLLDSKLVEIDEMDSEGNTALHLASLHHDGFDAMSQLLEFGADPEDVNEDNRTPFGLACEKGYFKAALFLLHKGVDHQSLLEPAEPIHLAALPMGHFFPRTPPSNPEAWEDDREAFLRQILAPEFGYHIDDEGGYYRSALHAAAHKAGLARTIQCLLDAGANVNLRDEIGRTPILRAFDSENARVITSKIVPLLRHGARLDIRCTPVYYESACAFDVALRMARAGGDYSIIDFIFRHATSANFGEDFLSNVLFRSLYEGRFAECRTLMSHGAVLKLHDEQLWQMVESSVQHRKVAGIQFYLDMLSDRVTPRQLIEMAFDSFRGYHTNFKKKEEEIIAMLLERHDLHLGDYITGTPNLLHLACRNHYTLGTIQKILDKGIDVNTFDWKLATPLHHAVNASCLRTIKLLLQYNANPFLEPSKKEWRDYVKRVKEEEARKAENDYDSDWDVYSFPGPEVREEYETAFEAAIRIAWYEVVNHFEYTTCDIGSDKQHPVEMILDRYDLPALPRDPMALSYVHKALDNRHSLRILLKRGADPNAGRHCKRPPLLHVLHSASRDWHVTVATLLRAGADIRQKDKKGRSFLDLFKEAVRAVKEDHDLDAEFEDSAFKTQCVLTRLWRITTNDVSGQEQIEERPKDDLKAHQKEYARRQKAYAKRTREKRRKQERERKRKEERERNERMMDHRTRYQETVKGRRWEGRLRHRSTKPDYTLGKYNDAFESDGSL